MATENLPTVSPQVNKLQCRPLHASAHTLVRIERRVQKLQLEPKLHTEEKLQETEEILHYFLKPYSRDEKIIIYHTLDAE